MNEDKTQCECEHEDHFYVSGNILKHPYAFATKVEPVVTQYGTLYVCEKCKETCMKSYITLQGIKNAPSKEVS